jgi:hypothetical protein
VAPPVPHPVPQPMPQPKKGWLRASLAGSATPHKPRFAAQIPRNCNKPHRLFRHFGIPLLRRAFADAGNVKSPDRCSSAGISPSAEPGAGHRSGRWRVANPLVIVFTESPKAAGEDAFFRAFLPTPRKLPSRHPSVSTGTQSPLAIVSQPTGTI